MTILDDRPVVGWKPAFPAPAPDPHRDPRRPVPARSARPRPARPDVAPRQYRGTGIPVSRAAHARRPVAGGAHGRQRVGAAATVAVAAMAALITLWLGALANFSGDRAAAPAVVPEQLAVVQVQAGETLQQLAGRVAPEVPAAQVVERIRDLNQLDSAAVDVGQTLIAPVA